MSLILEQDPFLGEASRLQQLLNYYFKGGPGRNSERKPLPLYSCPSQCSPTPDDPITERSDKKKKDISHPEKHTYSLENKSIITWGAVFKYKLKIHRIL